MSQNWSEPASEFKFVIPRQPQPELSARQHEVKYVENAAVPSASLWPENWSCCFGMRQRRKSLGTGMGKMQSSVLEGSKGKTVSPSAVYHLYLELPPCRPVPSINLGSKQTY